MPRSDIIILRRHAQTGRGTLQSLHDLSELPVIGPVLLLGVRAP